MKFKKLIVYQKSKELVKQVYMLLKQFPDEERFALCGQMRRAAISVPSNIAEGQQRMAPREFIRFLTIARGSNGELQTQLLICARLSYFTSDQIQPVLSLSYEISKMLTTLIAKLAEGTD